MLSMSNNRFLINRGDTGSFLLSILENGNLQSHLYELKAIDRIYVAIEEPNQPFENAIVKKVYSKYDKDGNISPCMEKDEHGELTGRIRVKLKSEDTLCLMPGKYFLEIKLLSRDLETSDDPENPEILINTIIPKVEFFVE